MSNFKTAKDIATSPVHFIDGLSSVKEAIDMMKEKQVDFLFIQKRSLQDANGIIVLSDIVRGVIAKDLKSEEVSVYQIMSKPTITIPASLNSKYVSRLLLNTGFNVAPIEENGELIGAIHLRDLVFNF